MSIFIPIEYDDLVAVNKVGKFGESVTTYKEIKKSMNLREYIRHEVPTARFWLMMRLRNPNLFNERWTRYLNDLRRFLKDRFVGEDKEVEIQKTINKIELIAWTTMPSPFLNQLNIPRVMHGKRR